MAEIDYVISLIEGQQEQLNKLADSVFRLSISRPSPEMENDRVNIAWNQGIAKGKAEERQAIVKWLREEGEIQVAENNQYPEDTTEYWLAKFIENGEHLEDNNE